MKSTAYRKFRVLRRSVLIDNSEFGIIFATRNNITSWYFYTSTKNELTMKQRCNCAQGPKLRQTGWSGDHPEWYCPVCKKKYYTEKDGLLTSERPFKWPSKKRAAAWRSNPNWSIVGEERGRALRNPEASVHWLHSMANTWDLSQNANSYRCLT